MDLVMAEARFVTVRRAVVVGMMLGAIQVGHVFGMFIVAVDVGPTGGALKHLDEILTAGALHVAVASVCWWTLVSHRPSAPRLWINGAIVAAVVAPLLTLALMWVTGLGMTWFPDGFVLSKHRIINPGIFISLLNAVFGAFFATLDNRRQVKPKDSGSAITPSVGQPRS
jgi:amino acid transporter